MSLEQPQPDIVVQAGDIEPGGDEIVGGSEAPPRPRWLRGLVEPTLVVVIIGVALVVAGLPRHSNQPPSTTATGPVAQPASAVVSESDEPQRLLAPPTARPGESLTVIGVRDMTMCGPLDIAFDGAPVAYRVTVDQARPRLVRWVELTITLDVPAAVTLGKHQIQLYGPVAGGRGQATCADAAEHQALIAQSDIIVLA